MAVATTWKGRSPFARMRSYSFAAACDTTLDRVYIHGGSTATGYGGDLWALDLSVRYDIPLHSRVGAFLKAGATNITNNHRLLSFQTTGEVKTDAEGNPLFDANGNPLGWQPSGNCGPGDPPSKNCTGFGHVSTNDYQAPRTFLVSVGFDF